MKRLLPLLVIALAAQVHAATVYYQPTPYPRNKADNTAMPQNIDIVHIWDGWFNSNYPSIQTFQRDNKLQIGGWGDTYLSLIRFDLTGLPKNADAAYLCLWALPSGAANPSQVSLWPITSPWHPDTVGWNNFPSTSQGYLWAVSSTVNAWRAYPIISWYNEWRNGTRPDNGILIWPYNNAHDNVERFDKFASSRIETSTGIAADARYLSKRPILALIFTPTIELKMPLPGGYRWLVTNEIGGYECQGQMPFWPDIAHQGNNYFSIDFSWRNTNNNGGATQYGDKNTPVLAAAGGKIADYNSDESHPNGNYIVIDHDSDGNLNTGFSTRYLHLKNPPARKNGIQLKTGDVVSQGDQIGIMGATGLGTGIHLHFGIHYNNSGSSSVSELAKVLMEGILLKSYQTECSVNSSGSPTDWIRYYTSSNMPTGN